MILYLLYKIGRFLALRLPLLFSYTLACAIADLYSFLARKERMAVIHNIKAITKGAISDKEARLVARDVFRNFAKYLVDFFRFGLVDEEYIKRFVSVEGLKNIDAALSKGKGVIALSAHIGNWELGGFVLSMLRHPMSALVLSHQDRRINDFFKHQRSLKNLAPVEIGISMRNCFNVLKNNGLLALLGDRDFSNNGIEAEFFGRPTLIPKGPAVFSHRLGSAIVPSFMIRQPDDTFRLVFEEPIFPDPGANEQEAIKSLAGKYTSVIESYVKRYPAQWYMFREVWNNNGKTLRSDTVI